MSNPTLILNGDGTPWDVQPWEEVYSNILLPIAKWDIWKNLQVVENFILERYSVPVGVSQDRQLPRPAVIFLPQYVQESKKSVRFSRYNVFLRDKCVCQYCGTQCGYTSDLTRPELEHVKPRCQGGTSTFENTVTSCSSCNSLKGNMTEKEFSKKYHLKLSQRPVRPSYLQPARFLRYLNEENLPLWLKTKDTYIPRANDFLTCIRMGQGLRERALAHLKSLEEKSE